MGKGERREFGENRALAPLCRERAARSWLGSESLPRPCRQPRGGSETTPPQPPRSRAGEASGTAKRTLALPATTFIERFLLHVLRRGFKSIRHYCILGPAAKAVKLAQARAALLLPASDPLVVESVAAFLRRIDRAEWARCLHCGNGAFVATVEHVAKAVYGRYVNLHVGRIA